MRMIIRLAVAAALLVPASCTPHDTSGDISDESSLLWDGPAPAHLSSVMSVQALMSHADDGVAVVDLWTPDIGYWVEAGLDHQAIEVICPSGRVMNLSDWRAELLVSPDLWEQGVLMFSSGNASYMGEKNAPPCFFPCQLGEEEPDGTWTCLGPGCS